MKKTASKDTILGALLIELRKQQGVSKTQLCEGICSRTALARYEMNGRVLELKKQLGMPETEVLLINNIATRYWEKGEHQLAIHLHENMEEYYQSGAVTNDYKPRYLCLVNYSNYLGRAGRYDESIEICKRGIQWLNLNDKVNFLYNFYYNIGWNIVKKIEHGLEKEDMITVAPNTLWSFALRSSTMMLTDVHECKNYNKW